MQTEQFLWREGQGWTPGLDSARLAASAQLLLVFHSAKWAKIQLRPAELRSAYPAAHIVGCSTAGDIRGCQVADDALSATAIHFERARVEIAVASIENVVDSFTAGQRLISQLDAKELNHVFVLSEGLRVNGSDLVSGINSALPSGVTVSGGCAADGDRLQETAVWCNGEPPGSRVIAIGLYGNSLKVTVGTTDAWGEFGPDRLITKSAKNVLYELDGQPALALYKRYLGGHEESLPGGGLVLPLCIRRPEEKSKVVRAPLGMDEAQQSITFGGNVPEGSYARMMMGSIEELIDGAMHTAEETRKHGLPRSPDLSILVSCNGRRMILKQRVEEEIEAVGKVLGPQSTLTGFYSYGEIAAAAQGRAVELHNETLTLTTISEL